MEQLEPGKEVLADLTEPTNYTLLFRIPTLIRLLRSEDDRGFGSVNNKRYDIETKFAFSLRRMFIFRHFEEIWMFDTCTWPS